MNTSKQRAILVPLISVLFGLTLGAIIMLAFGFDPVKGYSAMLQGSLGRPFNIGETLRQATPLILVALGFAVASTAGFFNIGVAGQALMGWLFSVWTALSFPTLPSFILVPLCVVVGAVAGALWAGIAGALRAYFNTSEVIVTIMLNYTALSVSNYLVRNVLTSQADATAKISENASLRAGWLSALTQNSTLHLGIFIAVLAVGCIWLLMNKTTIGFELKAVGLNPHAADYAGMSAKKNIILAMLISGALAGLGGTMEGLGQFQKIYTMTSLPDIGFDGMSVSLLGTGNPIAIVFAALIFSVMRIGGNSMPMLSKVPKEVVAIVMAAIIFFVGANYVINLLLDKLNRSKKEKVN